MSLLENNIFIGEVGAPHGIKGWVRVRSFSNPREGIFSYPVFLLQQGEKRFELKLEKNQSDGSRLLAKFVGVDDRNQAETLTGCKIYVAKSELPALENDEYYWHQLIGLKVQGAEGVFLGEVIGLVETGAHDVLELKYQDQRRLIPFVLSDIVTDINLEARTIEVTWTEDYFDDDAS